MKINYIVQTLKCCGTCKKRIRNDLFELFCHADKGPLDTHHLVSEIGICAEYDKSMSFGYRVTKSSPKEND
jgi:hypothetical protein